MNFFLLFSSSHKSVVHWGNKYVLLSRIDSIFICLDFCAFTAAHILNRILLCQYLCVFIFASCIHKVWNIYFFISLVCVIENRVENLIKILICMLRCFMWIWMMCILRIPLLLCFADWVYCLCSSFSFSHVVTNNWRVSLNQILDGLLSKILVVKRVLLLILHRDTG